MNFMVFLQEIIFLVEIKYIWIFLPEHNQGHVIFPKLANFIDFRFLHVYVQSTSIFVFKIQEIIEKLKTDIDKLQRISKMKKTSI